ncbi:MAG TPA: glutamate-1-semialdehyde 2,1-aminomutase [Nitrospiria bacterium]
MKHRASTKLFTRAQKSIPGGVNSPVRAFRSVGGNPLFIKKAKGARVWDADGNSYIDYVLSWGPMILGHANPKIIAAIKSAASRGTSYGAPTDLEVQLAELIRKAFPSMERVRLVSSGTEATMSALRLARGHTRRDKILKFEGCYHGHADSLLVKAGSGLATLGVPDSPGVPAALARLTLTAPYNDLGAVRKIFEEHGNDIAALIVEPVAGNMGVVPPVEGFLEGLREITNRYGSVLIFDEVITGFRVGYGGAQKRFRVTPDLTCLGKIIGGGLPVGAYGGSREIMEGISPTGPVYQAGTLSGNPLAVSAGIQTLKLLKQPGVYKRLEDRSKHLADGLADAAKKAGVPVFGTRVGAMLGLFFTNQAVRDFQTAATSDTRRFARYFSAMLDQGIYLAPSQFESAFLSTAHTPRDIDLTIRAASHAFKQLA